MSIFFCHQFQGTIFFRDDFDAGVEAEKLREAMKGCGMFKLKNNFSKFF